MPREMTTLPPGAFVPLVDPHPHTENQNKQRSVIPAIKSAK